MSGRVETLDLLRGLTLVSMILYHGMWDVLYISQAGPELSALRSWYEGIGGHLWQQSICRTFILLSGFCVPFSGRIMRRGLQISICGIAVSAVTVLFLYEDRVLFGVLTFLGAAMLWTGAVRKLQTGAVRKLQTGAVRKPKINAARASRSDTVRNLRSCFLCRPRGRQMSGGKRSAVCAFAACILLFYVTRWVNRGYLRLLSGRQILLPAALRGFDGGGRISGLIAGTVLTALGAPMKGFFSTDYFSFFPWIFLFRAGMYLHFVLSGLHAREQDLPSGRAADMPAGPTKDRAADMIADYTAGHAACGAADRIAQEEAPADGRRRSPFPHPLFHLRLPVLNWMGRHSLLVYMLHQPVLYLLTAALL